MAVDVPVIREVVERVCTRNDVLNACKRRDLGAVIEALCAQGVTQGQLSMMTGIPQGRISEYKTHKRTPTASATFETFADGLGLPATARRALGLDAEQAGPGNPAPGSARLGEITVASPADLGPLLGNLSRASAVPVLSALRGIHNSYIEADQLMGSMFITGAIQLQMPVLEKACEVARGADRAELLRFASVFAEFGGWLFQDAGDLRRAMHWTNRALDYALELEDRRDVAYTLMRKAMIATDSGNPAQGLSIVNSALKHGDALTPRLRSVILRQRSYSQAALGEVIASARDSDEALAEAVAGAVQGEDDRAPYCTPTYAAMEAGASWALLGHAKTALPILEKSRSEWLGNSQVRDYAMCVSRLAATYAVAGDREQATAAAGEVLGLAQGLGSRRVAGQIALVHRSLGRWQGEPAVASLRGSLKVLVDSFAADPGAGW